MKGFNLKYSILAAITIFCLTANAQEVKIIDRDLNPVSMVQVFDLNSDPLLSFISNAQGTFPTGQMADGDTLILRSLGFVTDTVIYRKGMTEIHIEAADYDLSEVVITAQYRPVQLSRSVHAIRIIDAKDIQERAAINLRDVLKNELNIDIGT